MRHTLCGIALYVDIKTTISDICEDCGSKSYSDVGSDPSDFGGDELWDDDED
jgi:hypothetical protein